MISYIGRHAELYDIMYGSKPYSYEAELIHNYFRSYNTNGTSIIELACGTGNHAFEFEQLGFNITAFDNSKDMIAQAQTKAKKRDSHIDFRIDSMVDFSTFGDEKYDFGLCLFDSLGYVLSNENIENTLKNVFNVLSNKGIFCCEVWHSAAMLSGYSETRKREWQLEESTLLRISETELDVASSTATINFTILELMSDNTFAKLEEQQKNRFFSVQEIEYFLKKAGFDKITIFDGYTNNTMITDKTWHLLCFAHKE